MRVPILLTVLAIACVTGIGMEVYALLSPEHYIQVRRLEWIIAGVSVSLLAIAIGGALAIDRFRDWRKARPRR